MERTAKLPRALWQMCPMARAARRYGWMLTCHDLVFTLLLDNQYLPDCSTGYGADPLALWLLCARDLSLCVCSCQLRLAQLWAGCYELAALLPVFQTVLPVSQRGLPTLRQTEVQCYRKVAMYYTQAKLNNLNHIYTSCHSNICGAYIKVWSNCGKLHEDKLVIIP